MSNFKGYYFKIGECDFTSPMPKREGYEVMPHIVKVTYAGSGGEFLSSMHMCFSVYHFYYSSFYN